jgi:hypothetical protein
MPKINLNMNKRKRIATTRKNEYQKVYQDSRWKSISWLKRKNNPLCQVCIELDPPQATVAREVHHRIPWEWGRDDQEQNALAYDYDNTLAVCPPHHRQEDERLRKVPPATKDRILNSYFKTKNG